MEKSLTFILLFVSATMGFAQGKLLLANNTDQLIYFTTDKNFLLPADANKVVDGFPLAGSSLYTGYVHNDGGTPGTIMSLAGSPTIIVGLFAGTSASALSLFTTATLGDWNLAGSIDPQVVCRFANLPAGVPAYFRIDVYDNRATSAADAWSQYGLYAGTSGIFQATPAAAIPAPIWWKQAPVNSTLPSGTQVVADYAPWPGYAGLIEVYVTIPEPSAFALAGLGAASLMIFRRRR